jgi:hypothetical protein
MVKKIKVPAASATVLHEIEGLRFFCFEKIFE